MSKFKKNIIYYRNLAIILTITSTTAGFICAYLGDTYPEGTYSSMRVMLGLKSGIGNVIALACMIAFFEENKEYKYDIYGNKI